ncbi:uncharacterized protein si:dkey-68o6.6 isoform X2 [Danio aesculapii]|uniref:uncharacterized protein si:dkey-68o6.6 isoform X2 n=1 Tax=Danio aesculapii TaxID=1142201 RepID=UPI0024BFA25E|nr:uncharacterized protein si:dkey-68o6.6 isoform X2 [Danio aesculapii]
MDKESVTDTESESASQWDPKSSTESESWSEGNRENKSKKRKKTRKQTSLIKLSRQSIEKKAELDVTCGDKEGILNLEKYNNDIQECIFSEGLWFTPSGFEKFGGRERSKKWKSSIRCDGLPIQDLLDVRRASLISRENMMQTDGDSASTGQNKTINSESLNPLKDIPETWKSLFSKTVKIHVCRNEGEILQKETTQTEHTDSSSEESVSVAERVKMSRRDFVISNETVNRLVESTSSDKDSSSDESVSVAERVKTNRRDFTISTESVSKMITQWVESTHSGKDSPAHPTDVPEPAGYSVIEEAVQPTEEVAALPSFSSPPAQWQNPVEPEETPQTGQMQLFEFLAKQFNTVNDTLQSIDATLKKLVEKQLQDSLPHYNQERLARHEK